MTVANVEQAEACITLRVCEETADILLKALKPEVDTPSSDRSRTTLEHSLNSVAIRIEASDTAALRASINSYLRWVQGIIDMVDKISAEP